MGSISVMSIYHSSVRSRNLAVLLFAHPQIMILDEADMASLVPRNRGSPGSSQ